MKRIHGRKGQSLEFIEFRNDLDKKDPSFAAQKAGDIWNVFQIWPGKKGRVLTLNANLPNRDAAETIAQNAAEKFYGIQ